MDYDVIFEEIETDEGLALRITIKDMPENMEDHLVFSWSIMKLCQAFAVCHPDHVAALKKITDITLQIERELLN